MSYKKTFRKWNKTSLMQIKFNILVRSKKLSAIERISPITPPAIRNLATTVDQEHGTKLPDA